MDTAQTLIAVVIGVLCLLLVVLGVQVFFILRDIRRAIGKANKVLEDTSTVTQSVSGSIASLSNITSGVKLAAVIASFLHGKKNKDAKEKNNGRKE